jgi:hypothetical protein
MFEHTVSDIPQQAVIKRPLAFAKGGFTLRSDRARGCKGLSRGPWLRHVQRFQAAFPENSPKDGTTLQTSALVRRQRQEPGEQEMLQGL